MEASGTTNNDLTSRIADELYLAGGFAGLFAAGALIAQVPTNQLFVLILLSLIVLSDAWAWLRIGRLSAAKRFLNVIDVTSSLLAMAAISFSANSDWAQRECAMLLALFCYFGSCWIYWIVLKHDPDLLRRVTRFWTGDDSPERPESFRCETRFLLLGCTIIALCVFILYVMSWLPSWVVPLGLMGYLVFYWANTRVSQGLVRLVIYTLGLQRPSGPGPTAGSSPAESIADTNPRSPRPSP